MTRKNLSLVSVIIPTYNRPALLKQAIDSVLAQTYPAIELIVVDDGSTDETPALLEGYGDRIVRLRKQNQGGTAARNSGLAAARGEFVNLLDHDDLFLPEKIERQMRVMNRDPEVGLVYCGHFRMDAKGSYVDKLTFMPVGDVRMYLVTGCFLWSGAPLIRRECLQDVGGFNESVWSSDAEMWLRIAIAGYKFGCVRDPLGCYRILPDSSMSDVSKTERLDMVTLERVFSDPRLPEETRALRTQAYFNQRFWLATRYYTIGNREDGLRNLREALSLRGVLLKPAGLVELFQGAGMDLRVDNPVKLVDDVFDHLPPELDGVLRDHKRQVLSRIHLCLALRKHASGEIREALEHLARALSLDSRFMQKTEEFVAVLCDHALRLCVRPRAFVVQVLRNLPRQARPLARLRRRILGQVFMTAAARDYDADHWGRALREGLVAACYRPQLLATGRWAGLLLRSLVRTAVPHAMVQGALSVIRKRKVVRWRLKQNLSFR